MNWGAVINSSEVDFLGVRKMRIDGKNVYTLVQHIPYAEYFMYQNGNNNVPNDDLRFVEFDVFMHI